MKSASASPEERASWLSRLTFWWMLPTLLTAMRRPLQEADLIELHTHDRTTEADIEFRKVAIGDGPWPLVRRVIALHRRTMWYVFLLSMAFMGGILTGPLAVRMLVNALLAGDTSRATLGGSILVLASAVTSLSAHHMFFQILRLMVRIRAGFSTAIYRKILRLSPESRRRYMVGEVINLVTTDLNRFVLALNFIFSFWMHPLMTGLSLWLLYELLGIAGLVGAGVLILAVMMSFIQARLTRSFRKRHLQWSDTRISLISEFLTSIRTIKAYGWEDRFAEKIDEQRHGEQRQLARMAILRAVATLVYHSTPILCALVTFSTKLLLDGTLSPGEVFAGVGILSSLRFAVSVFPETISAWIESIESLRRIDRFLACPEQQEVDRGDLPRGAITLHQATVRWSSGAEGLSHVSLQIEPGEHVVLTGGVGAGKSILLGLMAGEQEVTSGKLFRHGEVAYVPQVPWILNDTLRNNILFGEPFDEQRFNAVLRAAQLLPDIAQLPAGSDTEIGEQGVNLSGGQRQRLALARAAYSTAPIVLLDDPLAALDHEVGARICRELIGGWLTDRTVVMVTHRQEFFGIGDRIIRLDHGRLVAPDAASSDDSYQVDSSSPSESTATADADGSFTELEERFTGALEARAVHGYFSLYFRAWIVLLFILFFAGFEGIRLWSDVFLADASRVHANPWDDFIIPYAWFSVALCACAFGRSLLTNVRGVIVATKLHHALLRGVAYAPLSFFDRNPRGRILNRFSRDIEQLDTTVTANLFEVAGCLFAVFAQLAFLTVLSPAALIPISLGAVVYYFAQRLYRPAARESQRLDAMMRSPVISQFSETLHGVAVIRSSGSAERFFARMIPRLDMSSRAFATVVGCNRWVGIWVEMLSVLIVTSVVVLALGTGGPMGGPALIALALVYALNLNGLLNWTLRTITMLEAGLTSAERVQFYAEQISERRHGEAPVNFATTGSIKVTDLSVRYRPDLPRILHGVTFSINPGERIGIVGRTGSGKSTLMQAFLRLIEPESGRITIDEHDTQTIALPTLRRSLAYIPQEPVIFVGTARFNLDPFHERRDDELREILTIVQLGSVIPSLDFPLTEGGANISFGQRQLLCLGRALARRSKILLLDEATSGVDSHTDAVMQRVIRSYFSGSTIIAIAHRRDTIADYDRIIEVERGRIKSETAGHS